MSVLKARRQSRGPQGSRAERGVLIKPLITEKSMQDAASGKYSFAVAREAGKAEIARAISQAFSVKVTTLKTMVVKGKTRRTGKKRQEIHLSPWKKAIAKLAAGQKIPLFDVAEEKPVKHEHHDHD